MNHRRTVSPQRAQKWFTCMHSAAEQGCMCRPKPWVRKKTRGTKQLEFSEIPRTN